MQGNASWLALLAILGSMPVLAAQWTIGSATSVPDTPVTIPITFAGDGLTTDTDLTLTLDESRRWLPVARERRSFEQRWLWATLELR